MKKFRSILATALALVLVFASFSIASVSAESVKGDINGDGGIADTRDVLLIRKYIAKQLAAAVTFDATAADVNQDGNVDAKDCLLMLKYRAGHFTDFPTAENPNLPVGVPGSYPDVLADRRTIRDCQNYSVTINQCGYSTDDIKVAKMTEDKENSPAKENSLIVDKNVYLVDTATNTVVKTIASGRRAIFAKINMYVSTLDFSDFTTPGKYRLYSPIGYSYEFEIKDNAYSEVTDAMIHGLYYQRCGCKLEDSLVEKYHEREACHIRSTGNNAGNEVTIMDTYDAESGKFISDGKTYPAADFQGGLHDAGDYGRYTTPAAQTVADLIYAYEMYPEAYTLDVIQDKQGENIPDILDEARWEAEFLMKMQNPQGGIYFKICTNKFASATWSTPNADKSFNEEGLRVQHATFASTAAGAGALAACAKAFEDIDPDFSARALASAEKAFEYYVNDVNGNGDMSAAEVSKRKAAAAGLDNPTVGGGPYGGSEYMENCWFMACALYRATGKAVYNNLIYELAATGNGYKTNLCATGAGGFGSIAYLLANRNDSSLATDDNVAAKCLTPFANAASSHYTNATRDAFNSAVYSGKYSWGSNNQICVMIKSSSLASYFSEKSEDETNEAYAERLKSYLDTNRYQMNFILGSNPQGICMVTGAGTRASSHIHHYPSGILQNMYKDAACAPGLMAGGYTEANTSKSQLYYDDVLGDHVANEICIYWNSSSIFTFGAVVADDLK